MITVLTSDYTIISANVTDTIGGKQIYLYLSPQLVDTVAWVQQHRQRLEREQQIRDQDPMARELYAQYETYIGLVNK